MFIRNSDKDNGASWRHYISWLGWEQLSVSLDGRMDGWMDEICLFLGYLTTLAVLVLAVTDVVSVLSHLLTSV